MENQIENMEIKVNIVEYIRVPIESPDAEYPSEGYIGM